MEKRNMPEISGRKTKPRASKPKTKTGCVTCKIRRVKCDEAKPTCNRCIKACIPCDGYVTPIKRPSLRPVLPLIALDFEPILWEPSNHLCQSEADFRYLRVFCEKTAHQLNGIAPTNLWSGLMLQACEHNSAVRHGIIAISALDITSRLKTDRIPNHRCGAGTSPADPRTHYQFALREYSLAIQAMQKDTSKGTLDLATTLITCLVIICFETFHGNSYNALSQINTGLLLIEQSVAPNNDTPPNLVDGIFSSLLSHVDESLVRAFVRLDLQAMSFIGNLTRGIPNPAFRMGSALTSLRSMPARFLSLSEARNYLELLMVRGMHSCNPDIHKRPGRRHILPHSNRPYVPATTTVNKRDCLAEVHRWYEAFQHLLALSKTKGRSKDFLDATMLELYYLSMLTTLEMEADDDMRKFVSSFQSILALSKQVLNHPDVKNDRRLFAFDLEVVLPLFGLGWRCPHSKTRREAIDLLLGTQRQEGLWDGAMVGRIVEWICGLEEEEGLGADGCVPPERRILSLTAEFDVLTRTLNVSGLMPKKGEEGRERVYGELSW
ncbi:hypothetical protein N431DRAFT_374634 [Stipitochalara longipes BDJ]|nr:hypothetical protein N431DRAFT_374634 [Stipitochalara longipes BDJ]